MWVGPLGSSDFYSDLWNVTCTSDPAGRGMFNKFTTGGAYNRFKTWKKSHELLGCLRVCSLEFDLGMAWLFVLNTLYEQGDKHPPHFHIICFPPQWSPVLFPLWACTWIWARAKRVRKIEEGKGKYLQKNPSFYEITLFTSIGYYFYNFTFSQLTFLCIRKQA